jgi:hypothetical protein
MAKMLISADPGALMKVAEAKGIGSFKALSEKTGSDRKTLRSINDGRPVKDTTLQTIAAKLRVPISHLRKEQLPGSFHRPPGLREIVLQPLNAKLLRELVEALDSAPGDIQWILKIDQLPDGLEAQILNFEKLVDEWTVLLGGVEQWGKGKAHTLEGQLAKVRMTTDIESHIQAFSAANIRLFGANCLWWTKHSFVVDEPCPELPVSGCGWDYDSHTVGVIAIEPKNATLSKHRIDLGEEPPASFDEQSLPADVRWVRVDNVVVYKRSNSNLDLSEAFK